MHIRINTNNRNMVEMRERIIPKWIVEIEVQYQAALNLRF